jgi:hypothetical protein
MDAPKRFLNKIDYNGFFVISNFPTFSNRKDRRSIIDMVFAFLDQWFGPKEPPLARQIFLEALENATEHGNKSDPSKKIIIGIWIGESGVLFGIKDEGDFFENNDVKYKIRRRCKIPSSRPPSDGGGAGLKLGVYRSDCLGVQNGTLFFAVLTSYIKESENNPCL